MRSLLLAALAIAALAGSVTYKPIDANAAVCAVGVYRAGCVGRNGALVVRRPARVCHYHWVWVNGVRVRRCR